MPAVAEVISKEEFSTEKLAEIYKQAFMDPELQDDGEIKLVLGTTKVFVKVESGRFLMRVWALYGIREDATREQILEFCNRINDQLIMIRACYPAALPFPGVVFDHYTDTTGGITAEEAVDETRRFVNVCGGIGEHDIEHILT